MMIDFLYFQLLIVILVVMLLSSMFRILREYERGVIFLLGRFYKIKGPGLILVIPFVQQMVRVDLRIVTMDVPSQDLISKDNVTVRVNAVLYFRVLDPQKAIINVENYLEATSQLAQTTMRSVLGQHELDEILSARDTLNTDLQRILDQSTDNWGIKVTAVEIKHVDLDESMIRAIARQAEAERARRAKVIHATGELEASKQLLEAAHILAQQPEAIQLRYLQTLTEVSSENSKIIVFPLPMELGQILQRLAGQQNPADPKSPSEMT
ncbi:slipin family protein [Zobellella iuensis]|uniref:Protein QmcA n=1 Tax=Zobellella iuensis TaxID=2803811 RepID=A0ABS1QV21_9GAMM|nr:slipin family protein [Zobellella iuensis]MBL1378714.1 slipin family protein [Zobellella iuensis]